MNSWYLLFQKRVIIYSKLKEIINILKQVCKIIEDIHNADINCAFGDVHSDNFMLENDRVYGIDTDSMKIYNHNDACGYYTDCNGHILSFDKYKDNGKVTCNYNTDLYCVIMMILEVIGNDSLIAAMRDNEYLYYLDYLDKLGFNADLLNCFSKVYSNDDNINPFPYLDKVKSIKNCDTSICWKYMNKKIW